MDTVDAVVAALVRPGRVLGVGAQPYPRDQPHRCRCAARPVHHRVRRPVGQRETEGDPHGRRRCHPSVRPGRARRSDRGAAQRDVHHAKLTPPSRLGPVGRDRYHRLLDELRGASGSGTRTPPSLSTGFRGSSRSRSPTPSSRAHLVRRATMPRRSVTRWAARGWTRAICGHRRGPSSAATRASSRDGRRTAPPSST